MAVAGFELLDGGIRQPTKPHIHPLLQLGERKPYTFALEFKKILLDQLVLGLLRWRVLRESSGVA